MSDAPATSAAFHALLDVMREAEQKFANVGLDPADVLDGYKWVFSITQVALDTQVWADEARPLFVPIVGPTKKWGGDNSDAFYEFAPIDPARTYRVRGKRGDAAYLSLTVYGGPRDGNYSNRIVGTVNDRNLEIDENGEFELILSAEPHSGNWLKLADDAVCAVTRDYLNAPETERKAEWLIECLDSAPLAHETDQILAARFTAAITWLRDQLSMVPVRLAPLNTMQDPYPVPAVTRGWAAGDAAYAFGNFALASDEVMIIEGSAPECAFWNVCLWNPFLHTYDYRRERVTMNGSACVYEGDGSFRVFVASRDPGHPNWISTSGRPRGLVWFRFFQPERTPAPFRVSVVSHDEARALAGLPGGSS